MVRDDEQGDGEHDDGLVESLLGRGRGAVGGEDAGGVQGVMGEADRVHGAEGGAAEVEALFYG